MTGKRRVAWREGMFLRPQHFQQQDRYFDSQINIRVNGTGPYAWGLFDLLIDEDLATLGKFAVVRASGVMPDGTTFAIPQDMPPPPPLDMPEDTRDAVVYLTLPAGQPGAVEFRDADSGSHDARFLVDEAQVIDSFSDDRVQEPIEFGTPNLRFGVTRDQTYGRITCGLARVREIQNKRLMFDDRYIPPCLDITASQRLKGGLTDILGRAEQRANDLARNAAEATDGGQDSFKNYFMLVALNRWCPMLSHLDSLPVVHPERFFHELVGMAGELATMALPERKPPIFPRYNHEDLQATFEPVFDLLRSIMAAVFDQAARQLPLNPAGPGAYISIISNNAIFKTGYFFLAVNAAAPLDEIRANFPKVAKLGPGPKMKAIIESALPGIPLRHVPSPPPQLRVLPGYIYFELDRGVPDWRDFATAPNLGLMVAGDWPALKIELWYVKGADK